MCGADGMTYTNACFAQKAGVDVASLQACVGDRRLPGYLRTGVRRKRAQLQQSLRSRTGARAGAAPRRL